MTRYSNFIVHATIQLLAGTALVVFANSALAESSNRDKQGCALVEGAIPEDCIHANAGQVVSRASGANIEADQASDLGDLGFAISIDPIGTGAPRAAIAGEALAHGDTRDVDRIFEKLGIQMSYDGLGAKPQLNVSTTSMRRTFVAGETATFRTYSNYPSWIDRAEIRIRDSKNAVISVPVVANGEADWVMPADGDNEYSYALRVYDADGRFDETVSLPLTRTTEKLADPQLDGPVIAAGEAEDRTAKRSIPVRGGAVTVTGQDVPAGTSIVVMGEPVTIDGGDRFVLQRILAPGDHGVEIGVNGQSQTRDITIPTREVFATGIVDLTLGRDLIEDKTWNKGRIAGFANGVTANGTRFTASIDTGEEEIRDLFSNLGRKNPDRILRNIRARDVWTTMGDDSKTENLAPTSGRFYAKVERDGSYLMWGDFKPSEDLANTVRTDRTLNGLQGTYRSPGVTGNGDSKVRISGHIAQPDSLTQRDVFRGTGGSSYFLSRRDIEAGSQTLIVELRDPTSGRLISSRRLVEGTDYRIDAIQGAIILNTPLSPSSADGGLVTARPLGDLDVNLVAQYEYVPTSGDISGVSAGGRAQAWLGDKVRIGVSGLQETTGVADQTLVGGDILYQHSEGSSVKLEIARSDGPGFGSRLSLNGGLEIDPALPSVGSANRAAYGWRAEGRLDLADIGGEGFISTFYDHRDAGFSSPDHEIAIEQESYGFNGEAKLTNSAKLTYGAERFSNAAGKERIDARIGAAFDVTSTVSLQVEAAHTDRTTPGSIGVEDNGSRTDLGARLTWTPNDDYAVWLFGQGTLDNSGGLGRNDRIGVGAEARLTDTIKVRGEVSGGSLGTAGQAEIAYAPNASSSYSLGYRLDPLRLGATTAVSGRDRGSFVLGAQSRINDELAYTLENTYSAFGSTPALLTSYGVSYTPSDKWAFNGGILAGDSRETDGTEIKRRGVSIGVRYTAGEAYTAGFRTEFRTEDSNNIARAQDRDTWLVSGFIDRRTSENWRLIGNIDAVWSDADSGNFRDGRYIEARLGYAYRPVDDDRLNALFSYTWLYDLAGADQVNVDGDLNGPRQRSHIINAAFNYDLNQQWTIGAKYGFRHREEAPRTGGAYTESTAHLGVLRLDYEVIHNWDAVAEIRAMYFPKDGATDYGALIALYRDFGDNMRVGGGYSFGAANDDLRSMNKNREGLFVNVIGKY